MARRLIRKRDTPSSLIKNEFVYISVRSALLTTGVKCYIFLKRAITLPKIAASSVIIGDCALFSGCKRI